MKLSLKSLWSGVGSTSGSFFSVACPVCVPAVGAIFSSLGLGLFLNMTFLRGITIGLLGIGLLGLYANYQKHHNAVFLVLGILASAAVFSSRYLFESIPVLYSGAVILLLNAFFDYRHTKKKGCCIAPHR